jgi:protein-tyrosine-phosphatase/DNA-binding HxlR family transcriptional regulator
MTTAADAARGSGVAQRATVHRALGDEHRLGIIDRLWLDDLTPAELERDLGLRSNLLAFHLGVLEDAGLVRRHRSQGDGRRRYVTLTADALPHAAPAARDAADVASVLFVCTHNAARSQLAAALWRSRTGRPAASAGTRPAPRVHPDAVAVAAAHGLDLTDAVPRHVREVGTGHDLVVSVCDRAHETGRIGAAPHRHWSIPDPIGHGRSQVERAFVRLADRIDRLAAPTTTPAAPPPPEPEPTR